MGVNKQKGGDPPQIRDTVLTRQRTPAEEAAEAAEAAHQRSLEELRIRRIASFTRELIYLIFETPESPLLEFRLSSPNSTPVSTQNTDNSEPRYTFLHYFLNSQRGAGFIDRITQNERISIIESVRTRGADISTTIRQDEVEDWNEIMNDILAILGGTDFLHRPLTTGGKGVSKCKKITSRKKYTTRKSPPYSASKCARGTRKKGNDGKLYVVKSTSKGVNRWMPVVSKKVKQTKKSKKSKTSKKSKK